MEYKHLKTGSSMISWRASARKRVFSVSPLLYYQYLWVGESGKYPWYLRGWPFPSNSKQCREFSPAPGAEKPIQPLVFPDISPCLARGPTPGASRWDVLYTSLVFVLRRFRDTVLASGGARHPHDVFQDFRGRPPSSHALLKSYGFAWHKTSRTRHGDLEEKRALGFKMKLLGPPTENENFLGVNPHEHWWQGGG